MTLAQSLEYVRKGADPSTYAYKHTRELIDKVDAGVHDRHVAQWTPNVVGAYPIVPEYLAGEPSHMRQRTLVESDNAPVRIVVEAMASAGVSENAIVERGAAIAALAMKMSEERPVELWAMGLSQEHHDSGFIAAQRVRLDCAPVSLAQCVAVFTSKVFARMVMFNHIQATVGVALASGGWVLPAGSKVRDDYIRKVLELAPQDLVIQGGHLKDADKFTRDPVAWVNAQLEIQRHTLEG